MDHSWGLDPRLFFATDHWGSAASAFQKQLHDVGMNLLMLGQGMKGKREALVYSIKTIFICVN